jgi:cytochrome P450
MEKRAQCYTSSWNLRLTLTASFTEWARKYGPILPVKIGRGAMVVLTSRHDAVEILDKQSAYTSHRPPSHILGDLVFQGDHPMFMDADERWKLRRKLYFQLVNEARCNSEHLRLVEAEATQLLCDICIQPDKLMYHPGRYSNSIIMSLGTYLTLSSVFSCALGIRSVTHE